MLWVKLYCGAQLILFLFLGSLLDSDDGLLNGNLHDTLSPPPICLDDKLLGEWPCSCSVSPAPSTVLCQPILNSPNTNKVRKNYPPPTSSQFSLYTGG